MVCSVSTWMGDHLGDQQWQKMYTFKIWLKFHAQGRSWVYQHKRCHPNPEQQSKRGRKAFIESCQEQVREAIASEVHTLQPPPWHTAHSLYGGIHSSYQVLGTKGPMASVMLLNFIYVLQIIIWYCIKKIFFCTKKY